MRKLIYLLLAAAVFFLAGVYQSEIFMILFLAEGMLFLLFFLLSRWGTGNVETMGNRKCGDGDPDGAGTDIGGRKGKRAGEASV